MSGPVFAPAPNNLKFFRVCCEVVFTTKDTKSTKFGIFITRNLRVLRGERNELHVILYPHKHLKNLI
jgi:hypothetical protein